MGDMLKDPSLIDGYASQAGEFIEDQIRGAGIDPEKEGKSGTTNIIVALDVNDDLAKIVDEALRDEGVITLLEKAPCQVALNDNRLIIITK